MKMDKATIRSCVMANADNIANLLDKGKDVEIRNGKDGVVVIEVTKKVLK